MAERSPTTLPYCLAGSTVYCNYCPGYCCYRRPGATLYLDNLDINRIARFFGITDGAVRRRFLENRNTFQVRDDGSCIFLSNDRMRARCAIHTARPRQCREFPYDQPCPYLEREDLLVAIQPLIEAVLLTRQPDARPSYPAGEPSRKTGADIDT